MTRVALDIGASVDCDGTTTIANVLVITNNESKAMRARESIVYPRKQNVATVCTAIVLVSFLVILSGCGGASPTAPSTSSPGSGSSPGTGGSSSGGNTSSNPEVLYVASSSSGNTQILAFTINPSTGALRAPTAIAGPAVVEMKIHPSGNFMYVSDYVSGGIDVYSIGASDGALTLINGSPFSFPTNPPNKNAGPLVVSPNGKLLFFADAFGDIATFTIGSNGALTFTGQSISDMFQPIEFAVDPSSNFLYVANHADTGTPSNDFWVYSIDSAGGSLNPVPSSPFSFLQNSEPWGLAVHPSGKFLYSPLSNSSSIAALNVGAGGALTPIQGSPFPLTSIFGAGMVVAETVVLDPSGKFLYVGCRSPGDIIAYAVNGSTGALTLISAYNSGDTPSLAVDSSGHFLYAPNSLMHQVDAYSIDPSTGALTSIGSFAAGDSPGALAIVQLP